MRQSGGLPLAAGLVGGNTMVNMRLPQAPENAISLLPNGIFFSMKGNLEDQQNMPLTLG